MAVVSSLSFILLQLVLSSVIDNCAGVNISTKFPALLIFGDSTSDTGNNNYIATPLKATHYPYGKDFPGHVSSGRFSNGKLVADLLVSTLGIKDTIPPFLQPNLSDDELRTGVNFASAGSGYDDLTAALSNVIPVSRQAVYFKSYIEKLKSIVGEKEAQNIVNGALVSITAGTNDIVFNYYDIPLRRSQFTLDGYQDYILNMLQNFVKELYDLGCRTMVIAGLPPVGCLPIQMTLKFKHPFARTCIETENLDAQAYNKKLVKLLSQIEASLQGTKFFYADLYKPTMDMITNPQNYGLIETARGCCGTGFYEVGFICNPLSPVCADSSKYLFFDCIHPGETAYRYIAERLKMETLHKL